MWRAIVTEINKLQTEGITLPDGSKLVGSLSNVTYDNLGGNECFGFVECFNATYYCRICEMPKRQCQTACAEIPELLRTKESLDNNRRILLQYQDRNEKIDFVKTMGLKNDCVLNEIPFFHITSNINVDVMHDICEGVIPFLLRKLFQFCFKNKVFSEDRLNSMIEFFDFGILNGCKRPSTVLLTKSNCNQNATQNYVLMNNLPFILYDALCDNDNTKLKFGKRLQRY